LEEGVRKREEGRGKREEVKKLEEMGILLIEGQLSHKSISYLVGVAPLNKDSGKFRADHSNCPKLILYGYT
jgi:hypothetical protein